jgi:YVTN family beta-propeller protein
MHMSRRSRGPVLIGVAAAAATGAMTLIMSLPASGASSLGAQTHRVVQAPALPGAQPISSRDRVYTADQTSNTVTVIDPATNRVLGTLPLGSQRLGSVLSPQYLNAVDVHGLGFSRDGRYLDVISVTTNTVTVLRTSDNHVVSQTYVGRASHEGFFTPDGTQVWVADRALSQVDIVDALHGGVVGHITTDAGPSKVLFSPDGKRAYVNHIRSATVDVIDVATRRVVSRIGGLADVFSSDEALSPDGEQLWAAHKKTGQVSVIDTRTGTVTSVLNTGPATNHPTFVTTAQGAFAYITVGALNETKIYRRHGSDTPTFVGAVRSSGTEPHGIWPSPDNTRVYVVNEHSDTVDVINTATRKVIDTLHVGQEGQALVYVADAVPSGPGTQGLTRQGLGERVVNAPAVVSGPGKALVTVRQVDGLDMVEISAAHLSPLSRYTAYGRHGDDDRIPLLTFATDDKGAVPQALAFTQFFGVYDPKAVVVRPAAPRAQ